MRRNALAVGAALVAAGVARAADGVLEISPACVATGCFPGDTAGFPVTTTADHAYVLTGSLVVPDADTSAVSLADGTTLDLNGFTLRGPITCTGRPAVCSGSALGAGVSAGDGATVRNGAIREFGGTGLSLGEGALVEDVAIDQNGGDGISGAIDASVIRGCRVTRNGGHGMSLALGSGSDAALVTGSTIAYNVGDGVRAAAVGLIGNTVVGNGGLGLRLNFAGPYAGFSQNVVTENNGGNANDQTSGGFQTGTNVCGSNTTCP